MKMPEGWNRLKSVIDSIKVEPNDPRNYDHAHIAQLAVHKMWNDPLDLMKEMAQILEVTNDFWGIDYRDLNAEALEKFRDIPKILNKFKEWK